MMNRISETIIVLVIVFVTIYAKIKGTAVFSVFCSGVERGMKTAVKILPILITMLAAISAFRDGGAMKAILSFIKPLTDKLNLSPDIVMLAAMKPVSGSGSSALLLNILGKYGPDSLIGITASVISASSETSLYVISVYLGRLKIKGLKTLVLLALLGDLISVILSIWLCLLFYGNK